MADHLSEDNQRSLQPGEIVTVAPALTAEMGRYLYVVVDGFLDPRYTIARLGGDGYQWPNVHREDLIAGAPRWIIRMTDADGEAAYTAG
ncbi:hypothetical protein [Micromonospora endolithica]|uniref:Uncharacterized protein n=1 Tax=Micromonospora endolithica TaxID=230091 RepID=A0A3A9ZCU6_9ACTN|nr:hypothetical protein [Micromonospora endolithica]RKN46170.1 hypothetical protein D7223_14605 [Micromonospora endolithica]TWJ25123.1 hypothetical protein JD76_05286 [Micromonospora endolithica]